MPLNPIVSIVSIHFFNREAATAKTKMDGVWFTTDYFSKDDPKNRIGYSVGKKDGITVTTNYYDASDVDAKNPIGCSVSAQDNSYSAVNYFSMEDTHKKSPIGFAVIKQDFSWYSANYFNGDDPKKQNCIGTSITKRDIVWFTTEYEFSPEAINAQKNKPAPQIKLHENPHTLHAKPKAPPEPQMAQPKNEKNKCCSIM
jgi:hypothetical protein